MSLLIKKNIVVITNTIIHSSNFYFGHFAGAEGILFKVVSNSIHY